MLADPARYPDLGGHPATGGVMLFDGWLPILRIWILGPLGYLALILLLRASGKRTLSKMNAFDFVVTISLGSTFASLLLSKDVSLASGVSAFAVLILLQFLVSFLSVKSEAFQSLVKADPTLLYHDGRFLESAMRRTRVTHEEIFAAARLQGHASLERVRAVVLETDSSFAVLTGESGEPSTLGNVEGWPREGAA